MQINGRIILAMPEVTGVSRAGNPWKKREYVLETQENYPKKVFFDLFGDLADKYPAKVGDLVTLHFDIESREYQGRFYTSVRGWKVEPQTTSEPSAPVSQPTTTMDVPPAYGRADIKPAPMAETSEKQPDELPF
ncbi:MAG: DUF3127 domain-containing protein [Bacteroidales bacterium]|nr:DUF3127 domain-containing protein [Bacteroidales bacterium]